MKTYIFTVHLRGMGNSPDEAWQDAVEATDLYKDPFPEDYYIEEEENDNSESQEDKYDT